MDEHEVRQVAFQNGRDKCWRGGIGKSWSKEMGLRLLQQTQNEAEYSQVRQTLHFIIYYKNTWEVYLNVQISLNCNLDFAVQSCWTKTIIVYRAVNAKLMKIYIREAQLFDII